LSDLGLLVDRRFVDGDRLPLSGLSDLFAFGLGGFLGSFDIGLSINVPEGSGGRVVGELVGLLRGRGWSRGGWTRLRVVLRLSSGVGSQSLLGVDEITMTSRLSLHDDFLK
jgi:hypothetical protein